MMPVRMLLMAALPLLVMSSEAQQCGFQSGPHLLESLQCYNDYTTHIRCTWEEDPHTHLHVVIFSDEESTCIPDGRGVQLPNGKLYRSCVYKTEVFSWGNRTAFFNTSCPAKATTLKIAQYGKVLSPVNVSEREADGGGRRLSWNSPYAPSSRLTSDLTYQVKYRRHGHDWTVVDNRTATHLVIEKDDLLSGYSYEARVRARGRTGLWSDWSPPVFWITKEEGAFNLQCVIEEGGVLCSWQVKQEHAQFLSYHLCWQTNGSTQTCQNCSSHSKRTDQAMLDFTCSVVTSEPELLTVELKSLRNSKNITDSFNIQPSCPSHVLVQKENGNWIFTWSRPNVTEKLNYHLNYQLRLQCNEIQDYEEYKTSDGELRVEVPPSSLLPTAMYKVQVRTLLTEPYHGQPSDWSKPEYFQNDQASWIATIIYILVCVLVAIFFIILYNALPACHRRLVLWKVSIPSPIKSKVLGEISSMMSPGAWVNPYCETEKTSFCVMQPSDNPITCKSRNSECLHLPDNNDSFTKSDWTHGSDLLPPNTEGSVVSVKSTTSFVGPYILCSQESSSESETFDTSFYSTFDEDGRSTESTKDSPPVNGGYVSSLPMSLPSMEQSTPPVIQSSSSHPVSESSKPNLSQLPKGDPPAYTPNPTAMGSALFPHPSGYCLMPNMDTDDAVWVQASPPPPVANTESQTNQSACGYVTLAQPAV